MAIWDIVTKPLRGISRLVRGKFKEGLGDLAGTAGVVAPFIPGVGLPLAAALSAAGSGVERATQGGDVGDILEAGAGGAVRGAAGHALRGIGRLGRPAADAGAGTLETATGGMVPAPMAGPMQGVMDRVSSTMTAPGTVTAAGGGAVPLGGIAGLARRGFDAARQIPGTVLRFARQNPELALGTAGVAADLYGASQLGSAEDRRLDLLEEEMRLRTRPRTPFRTWQAGRQPQPSGY